MTISDWLVILAIIIAPIIAVQIQKVLDYRKEEKERKTQVFKTLMATRATPLSPSHVEALNMIDIVFHKEKAILDAWKLLLDNFANYPNDSTASDYQIKLDRATDKSKELLADLLYEMAKSLNYTFDKVHLKRGAYIPQGHAIIEYELNIIRSGFAQIFLGKKTFPISIVEHKEIT